jgi:hypothetical protein
MIFKYFILITIVYLFHISLCLSSTKTKFILHTRSETTNLKTKRTNPIFSNNESPVFNNSKKTIFLVHGFTDSENRSALTLIRKEILKKVRKFLFLLI